MAQNEQMYNLLKELDYYMSRGEFYDAGKIVHQSRALTHIDSIANWRIFENGTTPLILAVQKSCIPLVEEMLLTKPDVTIQDNKGKSAIDYAIAEPELFVLLLDYQKNLIDHDPLLSGLEKKLAFERIKPTQDKLDACLFNVAQTKKTEVARKLFAYGANLNAPIYFGNTAMMVLMEACHNNQTNLDMVKLFLKHNPDLSIRNPQGCVAEDYYYIPEVVELLDMYKETHAMNYKNDCQHDVQQALSQPNYLNKQDSHLGCTPLMDAFLEDDRETFINLLEMGASLSLTNVDIDNNIHETINQMALRLKRADYVYLINKASFKKEEAYYDIFDESWNRVQNAQQRQKDWELIKNCIADNLEGVRMALQQGANINAKGWEDYTPLMYAVHFDYKDIAEEILQNKSPALRFLDIFQKNVHGEIAADIAFKNRDTYMLNLLNQYAKNENPYYYPRYTLSAQHGFNRE